MSQPAKEPAITNQVAIGTDGLKTGDAIEFRGSLEMDGETIYGPWSAGEVGTMVDWGFLVCASNGAPGIARRWEDEGKTWRRVTCQPATFHINGVAHLATPMVDGVQRCGLCFAILTDYRNAAWPEGDLPPQGWADGDAVMVVGNSMVVVPRDEVECWCSLRGGST